DSAPARLEELQARELAVAAVEDRVEEEEERSYQLRRGALREEERRAREADGDGGERHRVRRDARRREAPRDRERDLPLDVPRHEALLVLDQAAEEPALGRREVGRRSEDERAGRLHQLDRRSESRRQRVRLELARAFRLGRLEEE